MTALPIDLTVEIHSTDGSSTEFYQANEDNIARTLHLLAEPRLLAQPQLVLASEHDVSLIPCGTIDMILARTSAQAALAFPFIFPAGLLDIVEEPEDWWHQDLAVVEPGEPRPASPTSYLEIHTFGGWIATLKALLIPVGTVHDQRQLYARFFDLPLIAYRLMDGGIGLINPANITRLSAWPAPDALPETALPSALLRWTSAFGGGGKLTPSALSDRKCRP